MVEDKKVKIVFEFDRKDYDNYLFLINETKAEDVERLWQIMVSEDVILDIEELSKHMRMNPKIVSALCVAASVLSVKDKL